VMLCVWFYHAPLENHADPQITPLGTTAPWYFLWIQGALKLGDKVFWGIIFPTIFLVFLMIYPYIDTNPSRRFKDRRFALSLGFVFISAMTVLSYMGLAEYGVSTSPETEIVHELVHEPTHGALGKFLPVEYNQLVPGMYTTRQFEAEDPDEVANVLAAFNAELDQITFTTGEGTPDEATLTLAAAIAGELTLQHVTTSADDLRFVPVSGDANEFASVMDHFEEELHHVENELFNAFGLVVVTESQEDLRRLDAIIVWHEVEMEGGVPTLDENGEPQPLYNEDGTPRYRVYSDHVFLHEDAQYFD